MRLKISKVQSVSASAVTHYIEGQIPSSSALAVTYIGTLAASKYISLVDETFNAHYPCEQRTIAAAEADSSHSGPVQGTGLKVITLSSSPLGTNLLFAVCYSEGDGTWIDSALRLTISTLTHLTYGVPQRTITNTFASRDVLPQQQNIVVTYHGSISNGKWISMVDSTLFNNNPCISSAVATATVDSSHSGAMSTASSSKAFTVPQSPLLSNTKTFIVCYASGGTSGDKWTDSGVRLTMSQMYSFTTVSATHYVLGHIPYHQTLDFTYAGSLGNAAFVSFVDEALNSATHAISGFTSSYPCAVGSIAAAAADATHTGSQQATAGTQSVVSDTRALSTTTTFAVCYTDGDGTQSASWKDSGLRLTVAKVISLSYSMPAKTMTTVATALSTIPQLEALVLTYAGDLSNTKWISLVQADLHSWKPCNDREDAAAQSDLAHSGVGQAAAGNKIVTLPQTTPLDDTKTFTVCYAEVDGTKHDTTWRNAFFQLKVVKVHGLEHVDVTHNTVGTLGNHGLIKTAYTGTLAKQKWLSLVDQTLNSNEPCVVGTIAAASADAQHSGSMQAVAGTKDVTFNTQGLSTSAMFALCYTEALGTTSATWVDSGLRLRISKVESIVYGWPARTMVGGDIQSTFNKLPRVDSSTFTYTGDLDAQKWVSLVDTTVNNNNPCIYGSDAAASQDNYHSGAFLSDSSKVVTLTQTIAYLHPERTFALCYAETDGSTADATWADSNLRFKTTKVETITGLLVTHQTTGHIAQHSQVLLTYSGSLAANRWISLVDQTLNSGYPCDLGIVAAAAADSTHSGANQGDSSKVITLDTTLLDVNTIFAVCHADSGAHTALWMDTAIRLTISKLADITFGPNSANGWSSRTFYVTNVPLATSKLPQVAGTVFTYSGELAASKFLSLVDASLDSNHPDNTKRANNPCVYGTAAGSLEDSTHSGAIQASGSKTVTVPMDSLLDPSKLYALCYAETDGLTTDTTWRDSYMRLKISKVQSVSSLGVTHYIAGQIVNHASVSLTYQGTLAASKYISLVHEALNAQYPCDSTAVAAGATDSTHSGPLQGSGTKVTTLSTTGLDASKTYAVCYTEEGNPGPSATWIDSAIRITVPRMYSLTYGTPARSMTSTYTTRSIVPQQKFTMEYVGLLPTGAWLSLVEQSINSNNPCIRQSDAAHVNDNLHSGEHRAFMTNKQVLFDNPVMLSETNTFAVCYAAPVELTVNRAWFDSYIRVKVSKVTSTISEGITHTTSGHIANGLAIKITYTGSLDANKFIALIDATTNGNYPCDVASEVATAGSMSSSLLTVIDRSGPLQAPAASKQVSFMTRFLDQDATFAVCYSSGDGTASATWRDSSLRITVSKVNAMYYGTPGRHIGLDLTATSRIPQTPDVKIEYACNYCIAPLPALAYVSLVKSDMDGNVNPCGDPAIAAAASDTSHSGALRDFPAAHLSDTGADREVTIPQADASVGLATGAIFTLCYTEGNGGAGDPGWRASYLQFMISEVTAIKTTGFTFATYGHIPSRTLTVEYEGTLLNSMYISFIKADVNGGNPCDSSLEAATELDIHHSGPLRAGSAFTTGTDNKIVTLEATKLDATGPFAVCYSTGGTVSTSWFDSAIRVTFPKLLSISYGLPPHTPRVIDQVAAPTDKIPQDPNSLIKYIGVLGPDNYVSFVNSSLNQNQPCTGSIAATAADSTHSGSILAATGTKNIYIPQSTPLNEYIEYAVCYAEGNGTTNDATWADSFVRVRVTQVNSLTAHWVEHKTVGHIAYFSSLLVTYGGTLSNSSWISLVDQTLNNNYPCDDPTKTEVNAAPDSAHSGIVQGNADKILTMDTTFLDGLKYYALCYSANYGAFSNKSADGLWWFDSGIRLTVSKVRYLTYGYPTVTFTSSLTAKGLPQAMNVEFLYYGDLATDMWFSLVDSTFNAGNPCGAGAVAAAYNDNFHSGPLRAMPGTRKIIIPQNTPATLLNETRNFAVCYAEIDGTDDDASWRDSYIRTSLSRIESIIASQVTHRTRGQIPNNGRLTVKYTGSVTEGKWISLVDSTLNLNYPCDDGATAAAPHDTLHSGPTQAGPTDKIVTWNTTNMNVYSIYVVCYAELGGGIYNKWMDSGIRLTLPKLNFITYGDSFPIVGRPASPIRRIDTTFSPMSKLPQVAGAKFSVADTEFTTGYIPFTASPSPYDAGATNYLPTTAKFSVVDSSLNSYNPCEFGTDAAAAADAIHSGVLSSSTHELTIPQTTLLSVTALFAICYTEGNGGTSDLGWRDSYIRIRMSLIERITGHLVSTTTFGNIANTQSLALLYTGSLGNNAYVSFVEESVNSYDPCSNATIAGYRYSTPTSSGSMKAGENDKVLQGDTSGCDTSKVFAVCYAATGSFDFVGNTIASWTDSTIRVTVAKVPQITYLTDVGQTQRTRTMKSTTVPSTSNVLPQTPGIVIQYHGALAAAQQLSFVNAAENANEPCGGWQTPQLIPQTAADSTHSGVLTAPAGTTDITIPQNPLLDAYTQYAVCYGEFFTTHNEVRWRDSYIRLRISKVATIESYDITHNSFGHMPSLPNAPVSFVGSSQIGRIWFSLVEETLNNNFPCAAGIIAGATADTLRSGLTNETGPAFGNNFTIPTNGLDTSKKYALCYTEGKEYRLTNCTTYNMSTVFNEYEWINQSWIDQNAPACYNYTVLVANGSASFVDTTIRLTVSKLYSMVYGDPKNSRQLRYFETSEQPWTFNVLPLKQNVIVDYIGTLANGQHLSLVDVTLNGRNPCLVGTIAAAVADSTHSGPFQAMASNKTALVPFTTSLDETKIYTVCYAEGDGTTSDTTWRESFVRIRLSLITSITTHNVAHTTTGHIANFAGLEVIYAGALANQKWVSLVESTAEHLNYPCQHGAVAAASADTSHSGVYQSGAANTLLTMDTTGLDTTSTYAVCYTNSVGDASATWIDSGLRITIAKVQTISYWSPVRLISPNKDSTNLPLDVLPQVQDVQITYAGVLADAKWISLIDVTINNLNPCYYSTDAGAAADTKHSGPISGKLGAVAGSNKTIAIPHRPYLDYLTKFAICYAEVDGTAADLTWRDSYIRTSISKLESISAHAVTHRTTGHLANFAQLSITYAGTLASNKWFSLVDETSNGNYPCALRSNAGSSTSSQHSGPLRGGTDNKLVIFDTTMVSALRTYAVCYADAGGTGTDPWYDSALRITIGTVTQITYLSTRVMTSSEPPSTWNILPQATNKQITYVGSLTHGKYLSFVDQSLNAQNPCGSSAVAAAAADSLHSGPMQAPIYYKDVILPQTAAFLDATKNFTVCYAIGDGTPADTSWRDSYIRFSMSRIDALVTTQVSHRSKGHLGNSAKLAATYTGTLPTDRYIALVQDNYNPASVFPCVNATLVGGNATNYRTGPLKSEPGTKLVWLDTTALSYLLQYAVCYTEDLQGTTTSRWIDTGIRVTISTLRKISYTAGAGSTTTVREMAATDLPSTMNILPQVTNLVLQYEGPIGPNKFLSFVDVQLNTFNPCGDGTVAAATADNLHSGVMPATGYSISLPQSTFLDALVDYAVCYASVDGTDTDTTWHDSYIRFQISEIHSIEAHTSVHDSMGHLASYSNLAVTYHGVLGTGKYLSLVLETLNDKSHINPELGPYPCGDAAIASHATDTQHSGSEQALTGTKTAYLDLSQFDATLVYAVCYTSAYGNASASWVDTALRVTVSMVTAVHFGTGVPYPGPRMIYPKNNIDLYHVVPQYASTKIFYYGDLPMNKYLSLVDATLNQNSPCINGTVAAAPIDSLHSGPITGEPIKGKYAEFPTQQLSFDSTFAFCYAETDGTQGDSTWRDSYIRLKLTKVRGIIAHEVTHLTTGQIANVNPLQLTVQGSITPSKWISFVKQELNSNSPCDDPAHPAHVANTEHSGPLQFGADMKVTLDITSLDYTSTFAVCYSTNNTNWHDSAIRLTVAKLNSITYAPLATYVVPRYLDNLWSVEGSLDQTTFEILPQHPNIQLNYTGQIAAGHYISIVSVDLSPLSNTDNGLKNPCVVNTIAAAPADSLHSGPLQAANGTKKVTVPQTTFLDESKLYCVCYATGDGSTSDTTWADSYIRVRMSMVESISAQSIVHRTAGHIAAFTALAVTYTGKLGVGKYLSFVDAALNSSYPCSHPASVTHTADSTHSGVLPAATGTKVVTLASTTLDTSIQYAVCYTDGDGTVNANWIDSAVRLTVSKLTGLKYESGRQPAGRYMREFTSTNTPDASYVIPQTTDIAMTYVGQLAADKWVSVVADSLNGNNPCVLGSDAAAPADAYHSGPLQPTAGSKAFAIPQTAALLDVNTRFAFCYAEGDGSATDIWKDSYIRMKISKLYKVVSKGVYHTTTGHIDAAANLPITMQGGLAATSFISLIERNLNNGLPCAASEASTVSDTLHSGAAQATAYDAFLNTDTMDSSKEYAVCYAEGDGSASDVWRDSGIRLTLSRVTMITYGDPYRTFISSSTGTARLLPSAPSIQFTFTGIIAGGAKFALMKETLASGNPCMTPSVPAASADVDHSGVGPSTASKVVTLQTNSLDPTSVYALCYSTGDGAVTDFDWRDSYLRVTMQRIKLLKASGVEVSTTGVFPYADKLEVIYEGRLDQYVWMSFVGALLNGGNPCGDATVAAAAKDTNHSGSFRAGFGTKIVYPFITTGLTGNQEYAVCYTEAGGDISASWIDTGLRIRFFGWVNTLQNRYVSGARSKLSFHKNNGIVSGDLIAILPEDATTTCANALDTVGVSDGSKALITLNANAETNLPFLQPGYFFMCYCALNGHGGGATACRNDNQGFALLSPASFRVIVAPRLGNITMPGHIRSITGRPQSYYIKGGTETAFIVQNDDQIFFAPSCGSIPSAGSSSNTVPLSVTLYDFVTKSGKVTTLSSPALESDGTGIRTLVACFATKEAVSQPGVRAAAANDYITLTDNMHILPLPRLGALAKPADLFAVRESIPSFRLHNFFPGDFFFFGESCDSIPAPSESATPFLNGIYDAETSSAMFNLPTAPALTDLNGETRTLKCCFAPARSDIYSPLNWCTLQDTLNIIPDPITNLKLNWKTAAVDVLDFSGPTGHAAKEGDIVLLQKGNCDNAHTLSALSPNTGLTHSAPMILEAGGVAATFALAQGKLNELGVGEYRICFATSSSEYDTISDFKMLDAILTLTSVAVSSPALVVPDSVHLGVDIIVVWNATDGQYSGKSIPGSWLGLYKKDACSTRNEWQHKCYLKSYELPVGESGGVVRFPQKDYKSAGDYEVRYFRGNSRSGQGQVCAGMKDSGTGTYIQCSLDPAAVSSTVHVYGSIESQDDMSSIPGLEHVVIV